MPGQPGSPRSPARAAGAVTGTGSRGSPAAAAGFISLAGRTQGLLGVLCLASAVPRWGRRLSALPGLGSGRESARAPALFLLGVTQVEPIKHAQKKGSGHRCGPRRDGHREWPSSECCASPASPRPCCPQRWALAADKVSSGQGCSCPCPFSSLCPFSSSCPFSSLCPCSCPCSFWLLSPRHWSLGARHPARALFPSCLRD